MYYSIYSYYYEYYILFIIYYLLFYYYICYLWDKKKIEKKNFVQP